MDRIKKIATKGKTMNNPFRKKTKAEQLDLALKQLVASCETVDKILSTVNGETKHTLNLQLCLDDTTVISNHLRGKLNKPKEEVDDSTKIEKV